jgi:alanine dehydrogenase
MQECIEVMERALRQMARGDALLPLRTVIRLSDTPNAFACMPAVLGRAESASLGAKIITVFPGNDATTLDSHIGAVLLFDSRTGALVAIADASSVTAIRTAAVSGVATRLLARDDARTLALLGAGVLALPHIEAICAVRPVQRVRVWNRSRARADALVERVRRRKDLVHIEVAICESAREAVAGADVICTITSSRTPVLEGAWVPRGAHINAVGASLPTARELGSALVAGAKLFVDRRESAFKEAGDFLIPLGEGVIAETHIRGELGDVLDGRVQGRTADGEITIFKSLGLAIEDIAAVRHVYERSLASDRGARVAFGGLRREE